MPKLTNLNAGMIDAYRKSVEAGGSAATAKRKLASLKKFTDWAHKQGYVDTNPFHEQASGATPSTVQITSKQIKGNPRLGKYAFRFGVLGAMVVIIFLLLGKLNFPIPFIKTPASEIGDGVPRSNFGEETTPNQAVAILSPWTVFAKMKLTASSGGAVTSSQAITFKLYDKSDATTPLWTSEPKSITPDIEGIISIQLSDVPTNLFFENKELYLSAVTSQGEIDQKIPVSTANSASNLSGYYAGIGGADVNSIPVISNDGSLIIAAENPSIKATSGNLLVEGQAVTLITKEASDGDIEIAPDGTGIVHFLFEGTGQNYLNAQAPNLSSGSLYYGIVANNNTGYDLLRLQSGSKATTKASIDALGNTYFAGNLNVDGDIATDGVTRLTEEGSLTNITGYSQTDGNFSITQDAGDTATITKDDSALSSLLTLTLDERNEANSKYSTLVLNRYNGSAEAGALYVDNGNAIFDGQVRLGQFASNPSSGIGEGSLVYNTADDEVYVWDGSAWTVVGSGSTLAFSSLTSGTNTSAAMVVGTGGSLTYSGSGTINASTLNSIASGSFLRSDTSDNFTSGTLTTDAGTTLDINGDLIVSDTNIAFDGATTTFTTTGDLTIDSGGGQIILADADTLNIGGLTSVAYNAFANSGEAPEEANISADNDVYIGGDLEVDGVIYGTVSGSAGSVAWDDITAPTDNLTLAMAAYSTTFNWDPGADSAEANFSLTTQGEDTTGGGDEDQTLLSLSQTSNGADVDQAADALLTFTNNDANDPVVSAIRFDAGAAGTDFTYGLNFDAASIGTAEIVLQNGETIDNTTDGTVLVTATTTQTSGNLTVAGTTGLTLSGVGGQITFANGETVDNDTDGTLALTAGTTSLSGLLTVNGTTGNAIDITNTGITTDIVLQNDETIDNNVDGTITLTATNTALSGDLAINGGNITTAVTADSTLTVTGTLTANGTLDANGDVTIADINIAFDGATTTFTTTGDLTINSGGGQVYLADTDTLNIGGLTDVAYNAFANAGEAPEEAAIAADNDVYIGGDLEVDGTIYGTVSGAAGSVAWDDITAPTDNLTLAMAAYNTAFTWDPTANSAETAVTFNFDGEDSTGVADEDQVLLSLIQTSNGADVDEAADALLTFTNSDANDPVNSAIRFDAGAAGTDFTYGINFDLASVGTAELYLQNTETIDNVTDDIIALIGTAGSDNTDLYIDLDGTSPVIYSNTDTKVTVNDTLEILQYLTTSQNSTNNINLFNNGISVESYQDFKIQIDNDQGDTAEEFTLLTNGAQSTLWKITQDGGSGAAAAGSMSINDPTPDAHLEVSANGTTGGNIFLLSSDDDNNGDLFLVSEAGAVGIGDTGPDAKLEVLSTSEQLRLTYTDGTQDARFSVDSSGNLTIDVTGGTYVAITDDLQVNGGDIGISTDTDLIQLASAVLTVNGDTRLGDTSTLEVGGLTGVAYNAFANSGEAPEEAAISTDNDLYVGGDVEIDGTLYAASVTATALAWDDLTAPTDNLTLAMAAYSTTFNWDPGADSAEANLTLSTQGEDTTGVADEDQTLLTLSQTSNGVDVDEAADSLLTLVNNDANDLVGDAIRFDAGAAGVDFADGIDFSAANLNREIVLENGEAIIGQTADTITFEDDDGTDYATLSVTALTVAGDLAITGGNITTAFTADSTVTVTGTLTANGALDANGQVDLGDAGDTATITSSDWTINATGDMTGIGAVGMDGDLTITQATPTIALTDSGGDDYTINVDGDAFTIVNATDTRTDISISGTGDVTLTGDLAVNGDDITSDADLTINAAGGQVYLADTDTLNVGGLTAVAYNALANAGEAPEEAAISTDNDLYIGGDLEVDGTIYGNIAGSAGTVAWDNITNPEDNLSLSMAAYSTTFAWDPTPDSAETALSLTFDGEDTTGTGDQDQVLMALSQISNGADVDEAADALLTFTNSDANDPVNDAIRFDAGAAGVDFADGIDFSGANLNREIVLENGEAIIGQTADTITFEDDDGTDYATLTVTALTVAGDLAITGGNITTAVTADSTLTVTGTLTANGALDANGQVDLGDDGDTVAIDSSDWNINTTGDLSGIGSIGADGDITLTQATPTIALTDSDGDDYTINADANAFTIVNATDTRTELTFAGDGGITLGSAGATAINLTTDSTGDAEVVLPNSSVGPNEVFATGQTDEYCLTYESTGTTWEWQTCGAGGGGAWSAITDPTGNLTLAMAAYNSTFNWDPGADSAETAFSLTIDGEDTNGVTDEDQVLLSLSQVVNASDVNEAADALLTFANNDANDPVENAIRFDAGGAAAADFTYGINFDAASIGTAEILLQNGETIANTTDGTVNIGTTTLLLTGGSAITTDQTTFSIVDATVTTLNIGAAATTWDIGAATGTGTINNGTLAITGVIDANGAGTHDIAGTLNLSGGTLTATADLAINAGGGQVEFSDTDTINIGGLTDVAYNAFANSGEAPEEAAIAADNDVYIGGDLEVDGTIYGTFTGTIPWSEIDAPAADLTLSMGAYNTTFTWDPSADSAETAFILNFDGEDSTGGGDEDQVLLSLIQTSNGTDVDEAADALLTLTNSDANDPVNSAIRFNAGAAGTDFTYGINFDAADIGTAELIFENAEAIHNQTDDTFTFEDDDGTDYATLTAVALTVTGDLAITGGNITTAVTADSTLTVTGTLTANGSLDANGLFTLGDNGETGAIDTTTWDIDTSGNLTTAGDIAVNGDDITSDGNLTISATGYVKIGDTGTPITAADDDDDLYVQGDLETGGNIYLTGHNIYNVVSGSGTGTIVLATDPTGPGVAGDYNTLTYGAWLVQNATNNGMAALMVDQTKGGAIFSASASGTTRFTIANDGSIAQSTVATSGTAYSLTADSLTTGTGIGISADGLTSGKAFYLESTSTALTSGSLASYYWNPGSATVASGDLFLINVGANALTTGNLFAIQDNASDLFTVSQAGITSALPHAFTAPGDVSVAYDLVFTNQTASKIEAYGPLTIEAGESFENNDLTVKTYGTGALVVDAAGGSEFTRSGNAVASFNRTTSDGTIISLQQAGTEEGTISVSTTTVSYNAFTGSHYAWSPNEDLLGRLDVVSLTTDNKRLHDNPESEVLYGVARTTVENDPSVLGIYLARLESNKPQTEDNPLLVMAVGNADVWVAESSDNVKPGDYLISSAVPGHAIKDPETYEVSNIIARAAEPIDWSQVDEYIGGVKHKRISVLFESFKVDRQLSSILALNESGQVAKFQDVYEEDVNRLESLIAATNQILYSIGENIVTGAIEAQSIATNSLTAATATIDNLLVTTGLVTPTLTTDLISPLDSGIVTIDGDLAAKTIYADQIVSPSLDETVTRAEVEEILRDFEGSQTLLNEANSWNVNTATSSGTLDELIATNLYVTGTAAITSLSVTESLGVGSDLVIQSGTDDLGNLLGTAINTLSAPLKIQSLALAPVEIMAGRLTIATNGDVTIQGNLFVAGKVDAEELTLTESTEATESGRLLALKNKDGVDVGSIDASGSANFASLSTGGLVIANIATASATPDVNGIIDTNATAGTAIIPEGVTEITIKSPQIKDSSLVYVTPTSSTLNRVLYIKEKSAGYFVVGFSSPVSAEVNFNWWSIDVTSGI